MFRGGSDLGFGASGSASVSVSVSVSVNVNVNACSGCVAGAGRLTRAHRPVVNPHVALHAFPADVPLAEAV